MTLTFRRDLARPLHDTEFDGNTDEIQGVKDRVDDLEGAALVTIDPDDPIEMAGDQFYLRMSDATLRGPYDLPDKEWNPRGAWAPATSYAKRDIFTALGNLYFVNIAHTSASTFDPGASDETGDLYRLILQSFSIKRSANNPSATINLGLSDVNTYIRCTNADGTTINISAAFVAAMNQDDEVEFWAHTHGPVSLVLQDDTDDAVTLNIRAGRIPTLATRGATAAIKKVGPLEIDAVGDFAIDDSTDASL